MRPKLSILMAALYDRPYLAMWENIYSQIEQFPKDTIEMLIDVDRGQRTSGIKRQHLSETARGEYLAFVDDDDWVSSSYVKSLYEGCLSGADVVAFNMTMMRPNKSPELWKFGLWPDNLGQFRNGRKGLGFASMTANHLCAWRRDIATRVAWCPDLGYGDDQLWYKPLLAAGLAKTSHRIDQVLYEYIFQPEVTQNQRGDRISFTRGYVGSGLGCYRDSNGEIWIEIRDGRRGDTIEVRGRHNNVERKKVRELRLFFTYLMKA